MREEKQKIWDKVALLSFFDSVNRVGRIGGNLKAQKITFLLELEGLRKQIKVAHFRFFRYHHGPYSADLAGDIGFLEKMEFLTKGSRQLTKRGQFIIEYVSDSISKSQPAQASVTIMNEISKKYGRSSGDTLRWIVYKMKLPVFDFGGELSKMNDISIGVDILNPAFEQSLSEVQPFDDDVLRDLEEEFAIPPEQLNPSSPHFQRTVTSALSEALRATAS